MRAITTSYFIILSFSVLLSPATEAQKFKRDQLITLKTDRKHLHYLIPDEVNLPGSINFPTQIVRLKVDLSSNNIECDEVRDKMRTLLERLDGKEISGTASSSCGVSMEGKEYYYHSAYMDAYSDEGIKYLRKYIEEVNGTDFFGVPLEIEPAKGVIVSFRIDAGNIGSNESLEFKSSYYMKNKVYFDNLYNMNNTLVNDFSNQLATNNPELISSFIKRWIQQDERNYLISDYFENLANSNAVKFTLKYIFIMDKEPKAYALTSKTWYLHDCRSYPNGKCIG